MIANKIEKEYKLAKWSEIIQERISSGLPVKEFCRLRGITKDKYYYWYGKLKEDACGRLIADESGETAASGFAEVMITGMGFHPDSKPADVCGAGSGQDAKGGILIEINGMCISADASYPVSGLAELLRGLAP